MQGPNHATVNHALRGGCINTVIHLHTCTNTLISAVRGLKAGFCKKLTIYVFKETYVSPQRQFQFKIQDIPLLLITCGVKGVLRYLRILMYTIIFVSN